MGTVVGCGMFFIVLIVVTAIFERFYDVK